MTFQWDIFISHASEDKASFVTPLVEALEQRGLAIWFDQCVLTVGDSLRDKIDEGLSRSQFGVIVLSPSFFAKDWPRMELDGLLSRERYGQKVLLPIWHRIKRDDVLRFSPIIASRLAIDSSKGVAIVADEIVRTIRRTPKLITEPFRATDQASDLGSVNSPRPLDLAKDDDDLPKFYEVE